MVDLSIVNESKNGILILTLASGEKSATVVDDCKDGTFAVRYEHGWWIGYTKDGKREHPGNTNRDIIKAEIPPEGYDTRDGNWGFNP